MSTESDEALIGRVARQSQIIVGALITGVVIFLGIATVVDVTPFPPPRPGAGAGAGGVMGAPRELDAGQLLTWLAVGSAALSLPLSFIVPNLIVKQNRRAIAAGKWPLSQTSFNSSAATDSDTGKLATVYSTQLILGAALIEGAAFFAGVTYLLTKNPIVLGVAILLVVVMVLRLPTAHRVTLWISKQEEMLFLERQAAV
jgi:hypothetical protein